MDRPGAMAKVTFHGHATCSLETDDGTHLVIDQSFLAAGESYEF